MNSFDVQGHRGARGLLPENTVAGFLHALDLGVTTLEMDVVVSKDDHVVVSHDPWFSSAISTNPDGTAIEEADERDHRMIGLTYEQVAAYDVGRRGHAAFPRQKAMPAVRPTLREVIEACEAHVTDTGRAAVRYNIETKARPEWDGLFTPPPEPFTNMLYDVLTQTGVLERSTLQSFDFRTLRVGHELDRDWSLSALVDRAVDADVDKVVADVGCRFHMFSPANVLVTSRLIARCHELDLKVVPWTVNDWQDMVRLRDMGVDGLITDYPDVAVRLLDE